ncbi:uncharacterized protein LOC111257627 [Setaria italica]|nr:uncharacterized protein LOC111257627 [Setaria italica]
MPLHCISNIPCSNPHIVRRSSTMASPSPPAWADLLPEVLGEIVACLCDADVARLRAVCRAWHSAVACKLQDQEQEAMPWIVIPNGSFCTIGDTGVFFNRNSRLPRNVTCLGATDSWLALDCTDDVFRRTNSFDAYIRDGKFPEPRSDVKHEHNYLLHNPFYEKTVSLPELDSIAGHVNETFEIRKVLMRSASPNDLVAVTTNNDNCTIILCRPGKGSWVLPYLGVFDVAFFKDKLYGITRHEDLVAFDLADDDDGSPIVPNFKRVIRHPLADGEEDPWSWMDDDYDTDDGEESGDEAADSFNPDDGQLVPSDDEDGVDEEVPYEPKDYITTSRLLVESCGGQELLMVRRQVQSPPFHPPYTRKVELFKADIDAGRWVSVTGRDALPEGEALFLSRSFSKSIRVYGDMKEGCIYFVDVDQVFDTRSSSCRPFSLPRHSKRADGKWLTWLFPPKLVV